MALTAEEVAQRYPLHWMVWNNQHEELRSALETKNFTTQDLELKDPRGRTPLLLAVTLGYIDAANALLDAGADVNCEKDGWTAVQEATASGDPELLALVLSRRDYQRVLVHSISIPDLLDKLRLAPDFYVEMKWEFTSWVPLVSRMCPFDTYKVYKRGGNVRVDTTLVGFENNRWQRGDRTFIFRGQGRTASLIELDHEKGTSWTEHMEPICRASEWPPPTVDIIEQRLNTPIAINYLDTDKISFERNKSGIWGWRQDKTENVNGFECKVFSANNVELVSKTRSEHVPRAAGTGPASTAPLAELLAMAESPSFSETTPLTATPDEDPEEDSKSKSPPVTWQEYFSGAGPPPGAPARDVGRPRVETTKVQKFRATLWLCEDYPLELQEQIVPILDLMSSISSPHFAKLRDFIQMQLPAGFPVKIEIPLFHVLNARITFGNIFGTSSPVRHVDCIQEGERPACVLDDACFDIGRGYTDAATTTTHGDDDGLLHYAIRQSMLDPAAHQPDDQVDVWEALRGERPRNPSPPHELPSPPSPSGHGLLTHEECQLQRAIEASLRSVSLLPAAEGEPAAEREQDVDDELQAALAASVQEHSARQHQLLAEQRALDEALRLSLLDN
ncbi:ankyrin repeat domain-containing protein 13D [Achroia grisella]|uniref:ankyrin repeat domain-containing protein 13D n=1 Tax=Achroia grisella TaxID=688607 RepID=UPI0027D32C3E|nr:ankyrin repeat domain-containing protein 13D [Achroia grisella]